MKYLPSRILGLRSHGINIKNAFSYYNNINCHDQAKYNIN